MTTIILLYGITEKNDGALSPLIGFAATNETKRLD